MKVWIVVEGEPSEGYSIEGVYDSKEKADAHLKRLGESWLYRDVIEFDVT